MRTGASSASFVVIANHFKSKGSVPDGVGRATATTETARATRTHPSRPGLGLATFAARFADKPTLLVGDFNSYSQEDPGPSPDRQRRKNAPGPGEASYGLPLRSL